MDSDGVTTRRRDGVTARLRDVVARWRAPLKQWPQALDLRRYIITMYESVTYCRVILAVFVYPRTLRLSRKVAYVHEL